MTPTATATLVTAAPLPCTFTGRRSKQPSSPLARSIKVLRAEGRAPREHHNSPPARASSRSRGTARLRPQNTRLFARALSSGCVTRGPSLALLQTWAPRTQQAQGRPAVTRHSQGRACECLNANGEFGFPRRTPHPRRDRSAKLTSVSRSLSGRANAYERGDPTPTRRQASNLRACPPLPTGSRSQGQMGFVLGLTQLDFAVA